MSEVNGSPKLQARLALVNGRIILPDEIAVGKALVIDESRIAGITDAASIGSETETLDVDGRYISPGLIDIHIHGALGHSFNEPTDEAWSTITTETVSRGVTSLLATLLTGSIENLTTCMQLGSEWIDKLHHGTRVIGIHLEGPYFAYEQRGAQDPQYLRTPDDGSADLLLEHHEVMRIMSFAPELPGALELTARLKKLGIVAAAGHSSAIDSEVEAAMQVGLSHIIHIWSAQSTTTRDGPWRRPGLLEASLALEGLTVEMIADGKHLPPTLMKLAYRCLGPDLLCVISDATNGAGLPDGTQFQMGDLTYDIHDGVGMLLDHSLFAGSTTLLNQMIDVLTQQAGLPIPETVRMASLTPARVIGVDDRKGSLDVGKDADVAIFNDDFSAWRTMIDGAWVFTTAN